MVGSLTAHSRHGAGERAENSVFKSKDSRKRETLVLAWAFSTLPAIQRGFRNCRCWPPGKPIPDTTSGTQLYISQQKLVNESLYEWKRYFVERVTGCGPANSTVTAYEVCKTARQAVPAGLRTH